VQVCIVDASRSRNNDGISLEEFIALVTWKEERVVLIRYPHRETSDAFTWVAEGKGI